MAGKYAEKLSILWCQEFNRFFASDGDWWRPTIKVLNLHKIKFKASVPLVQAHFYINNLSKGDPLK